MNLLYSEGNSPKHPEYTLSNRRGIFIKTKDVICVPRKILVTSEQKLQFQKHQKQNKCYSKLI